MIKLLFLELLLLLDPLIWYKSMSNLGLKFPKRKGLYVGAIGIYYTIICLKQLGFEHLHFQRFSILIDILMPLFIVSATLFLFKGSIVKKIMSIGVFYSSLFLGETLCFLIGVILLKTPMEVFLSTNSIGIFWTIVSKLIVGTICWVFFWRGNKSWINSLYDNKETIVMLLINMSYEIPLWSMVQNKSFGSNPSILISFTISQIVLFSSSFYFWRVLKLKNKRLYTLKCELEVAKQNAVIYKTLRQLKHDILGHVRIMRDLCVQKKYDKLEEYMDGMYGSIKQAEVVYTLPDPSLSILIGQLHQKSLENGIRFNFFNAITNYYLPSHELCSLVNNLVSNAIEATCKLSEEYRSINITLLYDDGGYHIKVGNTAPLGTDYNKFKSSSKADKENHGIGMGIIHTIARKHHGYVSIGITAGAETKQDYDYVSITVAMEFKEIARIQCGHKEKENFNV